MKNLFTALFVSLAFIIAGCGSDQEDHSHGEDGDHTHETPAQQSSSGGSSDAVRIGGDADSTSTESGHSHDEEGDHSHEEDHSHADDTTHTHGDEEHNH